MFAIGAVAEVALAATASSVFNRQNSPEQRGGATLLMEEFDCVTPPTLSPQLGFPANAVDPDGICRVSSNSGDPSPPADSPSNAAFVNDPGAIK